MLLFVLFYKPANRTGFYIGVLHTVNKKLKINSDESLLFHFRILMLIKRI
jgi:hypothetical protein